MDYDGLFWTAIAVAFFALLGFGVHGCNKTGRYYIEHGYTNQEYCSQVSTKWVKQ